MALTDKHFTRHKSGIQSVGQYQLSGIPFITSSLLVQSASDPSTPTQVKFPYVSKFVTVRNDGGVSGAKLRVAFSSNGLTGSNYYFTLDDGESYTADWRVGSVYLAGHTVEVTASVIAGLTGIETGSWHNNWSGSVMTSNV